MAFQSGTCTLGYLDRSPNPNSINPNWNLGYPPGSGGTNTPGKRTYWVRVVYRAPNPFTQTPRVSLPNPRVWADPGAAGVLILQLIAHPGSPLGDDPTKVFTIQVTTDADCQIYELEVDWVAHHP